MIPPGDVLFRSHACQGREDRDEGGRMQVWKSWTFGSRLDELFEDILICIREVLSDVSCCSHLVAVDELTSIDEEVGERKLTGFYFWKAWHVINKHLSASSGGSFFRWIWCRSSFSSFCHGKLYLGFFIISSDVFCESSLSELSRPHDFLANVIDQIKRMTRLNLIGTR